MKIKKLEIIKQAEQAIRGVFDDVPFIKVKDISSEYSPRSTDPKFLVTLEASGQEKKLLVVTKPKGEPKYAREAINELKQSLIDNPGSTGIFLAPYISPQTIDLVAQSGMGTVDLSSNCSITIDQVIFVAKSGNPNKFAEKRDIRSLYSPKASRVLRVLLVQPGKSWKMQELAYESKVSLGQIANVKTLLLEREWLSETKPGILLSNPQALLADWSDNYSYTKNDVKEYYSLKQPSEVERALATYCDNQNIKYALTGFSGANRIAPSVRNQRVMAYVAEISGDLEETLQLKQVSTGANLMLMLPYDDGVFYSSSASNLIRVVSPIQLYLDLKNYKGRGEEAAETILNQVISKTW